MRGWRPWADGLGGISGCWRGPIVSPAPGNQSMADRAAGRWPSEILKAWRALLQKCLHGLFGVRRIEHLGALRLLVGDHAVPGVAQVVCDRLARGEDGARRGNGDALGGGLGCPRQLARGTTLLTRFMA